MATLENFQLDAAPPKPSNHDGGLVGPLQMELRCGSVAQLSASSAKRVFF